MNGKGEVQMKRNDLTKRRNGLRLKEKGLRRFSPLLLALVGLLPLAAWGQELCGRVVDADTKEALAGATVEAEGTTARALTAADGSFRLTGLERERRYVVAVKCLAYKTARLADVAASDAAGAAPLVVALQPNEQTAGEATVTEMARLSTELAMITKSKEAPVIVSNISAGEIRRAQDSNAGEVMRRVPGVSLIDDKFVMVRGLAQRYNNVWMNGSAVPSSEADTRAFSFDMLPAGQVENLTIVKTPAAEYPADYTGGFILIQTKEIPAGNSLHVTAGANWNSRTVFQSFSATKASSTDWLGFDGGLRSLHGGMGATLQSLGHNSGGNTMYDLAGNHLSNDWGVRRRHPWGDVSLGADWSHGWRLRGAKLGLTAALNYTNEYRTCRNMTNNFYDAYDVSNDRPNPLRLSTDDQYNHNARLGVMVNTTLLSANAHHKLQFKHILNQIGNARYTRRWGTSAQSEPERSAEYYYRSRTTYAGQLAGRHALGKTQTLDWGAGYAYANRRLPDRRKYILYNESPAESDAYVWLYQNDVSREWTSLDEHIGSLQVNDEWCPTLGTWQPRFKAGVYGEYRSRQYLTRSFFYWYNASNALPAGFRAMDIPTLLSDGSNFGADKLYLLEDVNKTNDYKGHNTLGAAYVQASLPLGRLRALIGLRYEWNQMELITNTRQDVSSPKSHYYRGGNLFPSLNLTFQAAARHQLRLAYGRSINRPEFREVAPAVYYDFDLASDVQGNYDLKDCHVDNIDLRWEWYPAEGELLSVAAFYKHFDRPIEWTYTMAGGTDVVYSYKNARAARNVGLEVDIRKRLDFLGLRDFSWSFNGALIHSRVSFEAGSQEYDRAMQGQSPYLVNTGLFYQPARLGLDVSLLYNRIGKRIVGVGRTEGGGSGTNVRVPDSYEMPRDVLDLSLAKRFGAHWELKLTVRDLLGEAVTYKQFSDVSLPDGTRRKVHQVTRKYRPGQNLRIALTWKL